MQEDQEEDKVAMAKEGLVENPAHVAQLDLEDRADQKDPKAVQGYKESQALADKWENPVSAALLAHEAVMESLENKVPKGVKDLKDQPDLKVLQDLVDQ